MVLGEVKRTFNPEFINRIDEIIVFEALTDDDLRRITALLVDQLNANLVDRKLRIALTTDVVDWIIEATCKDRSYGARPLRRAIQRYVEDPLSEKILWKEFHAGETIVIDSEGDEIVFRSIAGIEPPPVELAGSGTPEA
jgi:ATP-dependent Clp protease ATP-binding subunit ClpC